MNQHRNFRARRTAVAAGCLAVLGVALAPAAMAATYTVNTLADRPLAAPVMGEITLREAVEAARTNAAVNGAPAGDAVGTDTIVFDVPGVSPTIALIATLELGGGPLQIDGDNGSNPSVRLSGNTLNRVFTVPMAAGGASVGLANLSLTDGAALTGAAMLIESGQTVSLDGVTVSNNVGVGTGPTQGGAIDNSGTLTISGSSFSDNSATGPGGSGGAIINSGTLLVTDTQFTGNSAIRAGGAIEDRSGTSAVTLIDVTMDGNSAGPTPGNGGGLHITGAGTDTLVNGGLYQNNTAQNEGGALWNDAGSTMTIGDSPAGDARFLGNVALGTGANNGGGALFNNGRALLTDPTLPAPIMVVRNAVIDGNSAVQGAGSGGGILNLVGQLTLSDSTLSNNLANRAGGGLEDVSGLPAVNTTETVVTNVVFTGNDALGNGPPGNGGAIHITDGAGTSLTTISGGSAIGNRAQEGGAFWNNTGRMVVDGTAIRDNEARGNPFPMPLANGQTFRGGGGLFNQGGTLEVVNATIAGNRATGDQGSGGGIFSNVGRLVVTDSDITGNQSNRAGGGIEDRSTGVVDAAMPTTSLSGVRLSGNSTLGQTAVAGSPGNGGGLHLTGSSTVGMGGVIQVSDSTVSNNSAAAEGGGLWNFSGSSLMVVTGTVIDSNVALGTGAGEGGGGLFNNGGILQVSGSTVTNNAADGASNSSGGGILNVNGGTVTVANTRVANNRATRAGGGIEDDARMGPTSVSLVEVTLANNLTASVPGNGGGLHSSGGSSSVVIDRSTVSGNVAANEGNGLWVFSGSSLDISNSTVFGNGLDGDLVAPLGGGIFLQPGAMLTATNVTVARNEAGVSGGGVHVSDSALLNVTNSVIADNFATAGADVFGALSGDNNLVSRSAGATVNGDNNRVDVASGLDPNGLRLNGGNTRTVLPVAGSAAINGADNTACTAAPVNAVDQRNLSRLDGGSFLGGGCDIGAVESALQVENALILPLGTTVQQGMGAPPSTAVLPGDTDVLALSVAYQNNRAGAVRLDGFSGTLRGSGDFGADVVGPGDLILDTNGNGFADAGEQSIGSVSFDDSMKTFSATFSGMGRMLGGGQVERYVVLLDFASDAAMAQATPARTVGFTLLAGVPLALFGLAGVGGALGRRRTAVVLIAIAAAGLLAGCDGSDGRNGVDGMDGDNGAQGPVGPIGPVGPDGDPGDPAPRPLTYQLQFTGFQGADSDGMMLNDPATVLQGPLITVFP
ncbi:hypothetical protein JN531_003210 [Flagellatimonas centrodinii]|uniref:beta strand repeat-containing protein n=1 Tax=Flagellatimonas centrodinii TaxID=2806210 RepID=UPI001FFB28FE|nr:right-handed parallel beta-helix repeat-containing protein [Flagellatimonas centrodinii]ULQ47301.1 hypothetical protein JN531_003210 [Flagellatimonas centrodinii]